MPPPKVPRVCVLVCDSWGIGDAPDAAAYGDEGSNTLANTARAVGGLDLPVLEGLGLGLLSEIDGVSPRADSSTPSGPADRTALPPRQPFESRAGSHRVRQQLSSPLCRSI
jgi:hypothetical protein